MSTIATRTAAIIRADFLVRFRRPSTLVIFVLLSAMAYLWVPDPASGKTLLQLKDQRALYNSAALGMATSLIATLFIGLAGYYVVSNAIRRDIQTRCGSVIASTSMRSGEYLFAKFLGNVVFLGTFTAGFMVTSMLMLLVRGEAPLEPFKFALQYLYVTPPTIIFVSVIAVLFESIPWLSGKFGDVAYFFLWVLTLGTVASMLEEGGSIRLIGSFDYVGMGYVADQMRHTLGSDSFSIGSSPFDASKGTFVYEGLTLDHGWLFPRLMSLLTPLPLLLVARLFFHRFDPARVKQKNKGSGEGWIARFNRLVKPLVRINWLLPQPRKPGFATSVWSDTVLSFSALPMAFAAVIGLTIATIAIDPAHVPARVLPLVFMGIALAIGAISSRDASSTTLGLIYGSPALREHFVAWKAASTFLLCAIFLAAPAIRMDSSRLPDIFSAAFLITAGATLLGVVSRNPKTFLLLFLTWFYIVMNDHGAMKAFDIAGFFTAPSITRSLTSFVAALILLSAAAATHRFRLSRA